MDARDQHYDLLHRVIATISRGLASSLEYRSRSGLTRGLRRHGGLSFVPEFLVASRVVTHEVRFWRRQELRDLTVFDIGAFHGLMTIYFASQARNVVAFEPNPSSRTVLKRNLELNRLKNVLVLESAIGEKVSSLELRLDPLMPGGASIDAIVSSQIGRDRPVEVIEVSVVPLDQLIDQCGLPRPDLVKVDVEGHELSVLRGARGLLRDVGPTLYLEMHGADDADKTRRVAEIVAFLRSIGYHEIFHVETGARVGEDSAFARRGHLVAQGRRGTLNMDAQS